MAYKPEQWARARALFELGRSLGEIEADCGITKGQLSKRSRRDGWEKETGKTSLKSDIVEFERKKETLDAEKETLIRRVSSLNAFEITILDELVTNEKGLKSLIFSAQTLAVVRANEALTRGSKTALLKVGQYDSKGNRVGEVYEPYEVPLDASEIRNHVEAIDKAAITLKVAERHAPKQDITAIAGVQQNNTEVKFERIGSAPTGTR